jgi:hypothetical protein
MDYSMLAVLESDFSFLILFIMNWALYFIFGFSLCRITLNRCDENKAFCVESNLFYGDAS